MVFVLLARQGWSVWRGTRDAPGSWEAEVRDLAGRMGFTRPIAIREATRDFSPHVAGLFDSVIVLPPSAAAWPADSRHAAIVHELAHIRRGDRRTQALAHLACALYWFNPLMWYAAAGLARERERACDAEVLRMGAKPSDYATLLLDLARTPSASTPATALSMARPSAIEGRLLMILGHQRRTARRSSRWLVTATLTVISTAILGPHATALDDDSQDVRERAAMSLAITPGPGAVAPLLKALQDRDAQVREKAAIGLAFRRDPRIVAPLLTAMEDGDAQVREKAAIALGASGDRRAIEALQKALDDPNRQVREKAVAGLLLLEVRP